MITFIGLAALFLITGCKKNGKSDKQETLISDAYAVAVDINQNSFFGENCHLLESDTDHPVVPSKVYLDSSHESFFEYYMFDNKGTVTKIFLCSSNYHVYGIHTGESLVDSESILTDKSFVKQKENTANSNKDSKIVYSKGCISIVLYHSDDRVSSVIVSAIDPSYNNTQF